MQAAGEIPHASEHTLILHVQDFLIRLGIMRGDKQPFTILDTINGTLKPVRTRTDSNNLKCITSLHVIPHASPTSQDRYLVLYMPM